MSNPYESPKFSQEYNVGGEYDPATSPPSGMVGQVRIVGILNAVQGGLELIMGLFWAFYAVFFPFILANEAEFNGPDAPPKPFMYGLVAYFAVTGLSCFVAGGLRIFSGIKNWSFQGRTLTMVSLIIGAFTTLSCYCAPTSIAMLIYGLIVHMNPSVKMAMEMGERGVAADKIIYDFSPYRPR